jgi:hypothetical protein
MTAPRGAAPAAWLMALFWGAAAAHALSLRSTRAEAFLGESPPGGTLSYSRALGAPLGVENAGTEPARIELSVAIPPPGELADGYEALPDPSWVRLEKASHALEPGARGETDVRVVLPKDARLEGRQFQFHCLFRGRETAGGGLTLRTRLLLAAGAGDPPQTAGAAPEGFALLPARGRAEGVPLGRPFAPPSGAGGLKLVNAGTREATVRLSTLRAWPEDFSPPEGFAPAPNPRWLRTGAPVRLPAGSIASAALELMVPDEPRYRGRRWAFLVAADAEAGGKKGRSLYVLSVVTQAASKEAGR